MKIPLDTYDFFGCLAAGLTRFTGPDAERFPTCPDSGDWVTPGKPGASRERL